MITELAALLEAELSYACFNAKRTATAVAEGEIVKSSIAGVPFIADKSRPESEYYNRAVIPLDFTSLDGVLNQLPPSVQAIELLIPQQTEDVFSSLLDTGFVPASSLCYLTAASDASDQNESGPDESRVEQLRPDQTDFFFDLLELSGASFSPEKRNATRQFYCNDEFVCFIAYDSDDEPAGWATMYVNDGTAFVANAFTLPNFRGRGHHSALLAARVELAQTLNLRRVFTDVMPVSQSHRNCARHGFRLLSVNQLWKRKRNDE